MHQSGPEPGRIELPAALPGDIGLLAIRCPAAGRLVTKARLHEPLSEAEAHVALQIFGQLGEEGRRFVHQLLSVAPGYNPDQVNRQLQAVPPQPIGCRNVRTRLARDGAPDLCGCVFNLPPETYAAPIVHLDILPPAPGKLKTQRNPPPDLDGDGRTHGYLSRAVKAASRLLGLGPASRRRDP